MKRKKKNSFAFSIHFLPSASKRFLTTVPVLKVQAWCSHCKGLPIKKKKWGTRPSKKSGTLPSTEAPLLPDHQILKVRPQKELLVNRSLYRSSYIFSWKPSRADWRSRRHHMPSSPCRDIHCVRGTLAATLNVPHIRFFYCTSMWPSGNTTQRRRVFGSCKESC